MSQEIFKADPFLLKTESQKEYGRSLLWNVLVRRTSMSGRTRVVDLLDTASPAKAARPIIQEPPAGLVKNYLDSRIHRTALTPEEREALMPVTMISRGEVTQRRLRDVQDPQGDATKPKFCTHEEARQELAAKGLEINRRLRIAAVGVRVKVSKLVDRAYLNEDLCILNRLQSPQKIDGLPDEAGISELGRTTARKRMDGSRRWEDTVCGHIQAAVDSGSDIVVLPEFAFPPELNAAELTAMVSHRRGAKAAERQAANFIFAGSRHEGGVNRGLIIHSKEDRDPHPPEWHYKVASARSLGENILGPRSDEYLTYDVELEAEGKPYKIHATVAICYDSFDPSTFLSLVLHAATREILAVPPVILVPAFNPSEPFVELLRDLSFLTCGIVIYVNSLNGDARAFVAGFSIGDLLDQSSDKLLTQVSDHVEELRGLCADLRDEISAANKQGQSKIARDLRSEMDFYRQQLTTLEAFEHRIQKLREEHGLEHLITVESCADCHNQSHLDDYECRSDILYYNIDIRLIETLREWRRTYFMLDESFLPEPFHHQQLDKAVTEQALRDQSRADRIRRTYT